MKNGMNNLKKTKKSEEGKILYDDRKNHVERSFADSKQNHGYRYAMYKGVLKNQHYTWLICATQNMKNIAIKNDKDCCEVYALYNKKLRPICEDVNNNCYDLALVKYFRFIKNLSKKYSDIIDFSNCVIDNNNKNSYVKYRKSIRKI